MRIRPVPGFLVAFFVTACLPAAPARAQGGIAAPPAPNEREAMVRVVTDYHLGCDGGTRTSWDNMAAAWYEEITNGAAAPAGHGGASWFNDGFYHQQWMTFENGLWKTNYIVDSDFTDPNLVAWGRDYQYDKPDEVDAFMLATHGGGGGLNNSWSASMLKNELGTGDCSAVQNEMQFGDLDLEFLHLSSCSSMDQEDWLDWSSSFQGLHQIDAFHGVMWISGHSDWLARYRDFADDSYSMGMSLAWIDNMYKYTCAILTQDPIQLERWDQCPVARGVGYSQADAIDRLTHEEYDNILSEPVNPTWQHAFYLNSCDPKSQPPINNIVTECDPFYYGIPESRAPVQASMPESVTTGIPGVAAGFAEYRAQIDAMLPHFDATVLVAPAGPDWMAGLTIAQVAAAVGDTPPSAVISNGTRQQAETPAGEFFRIDTAAGRVRYASRPRQFDWNGSPHTAWPEATARGLVMGAFGALGVPTAELDPARCCRADLVSGSLFETANPSQTPSDTYDAERMITIQRTINNLPVIESMVRASVSNTGQIARLLVRWPRFVMPAGMVLRSRAEVLDELAQHLTDVEFGRSVNLASYVGYERRGTQYYPVAVVQYEDGESGEIISASLVVLPSDGDTDGIPDTADNCPGRDNADQSDRDRDGRGDTCDNCPDVANPGQEDSEGDGTGDACASADGACVFTSGICDDATAAQCTAAGGAWQGAGSNCATAMSPVLFADGNTLHWTAPPAIAAWDLVRGSISLLKQNGGNYAAAGIGCVAPDYPGTVITTTDLPPVGDALFFYLRNTNGPSHGTYDDAGTGLVEGRDLEIAASGGDCP